MIKMVSFVKIYQLGTYLWFFKENILARLYSRKMPFFTWKSDVARLIFEINQIRLIHWKEHQKTIGDQLKIEKLSLTPFQKNDVNILPFLRFKK